MTAALAECGYFMGDGSLHSRGLRFCVANTDFDVLERMEILAKECFGVPTKVTPKRGYGEVAHRLGAPGLWWEACGFAKRPPTEGHSGKGYIGPCPRRRPPRQRPPGLRRLLARPLRGRRGHSAGYPTLKNTSVQMVRDVQSILLAPACRPPWRSRTARTTHAWVTPAHRLLPLLNVCTTPVAGRHRLHGGPQERRRARGRPEVAQTGRHDYIPLTRTLIDRLAPGNDRLRRVLMMELGRGKVSRRIATELFERTGDAELGHLLGFFDDSL